VNLRYLRLATAYYFNRFRAVFVVHTKFELLEVKVPSFVSAHRVSRYAGTDIILLCMEIVVQRREEGHGSSGLK
jgi:hypothetical protein